MLIFKSFSVAQVFGTAWVKLLNDALHFVGPVLLNRIVNFVKGTGVEGEEASGASLRDSILYIKERS